MNNPPVITDDLTITVTDEDNNPIENATVTVTDKIPTTNVTVTTLDSDSEPLINSEVAIALKPLSDPSFDPHTDILGVGQTDDNGQCTIMTVDVRVRPTDVPLDVEYGTYWLLAVNNTLGYLEQVSVDGEHNDFTVTLIEQG